MRSYWQSYPVFQKDRESHIGTGVSCNCLATSVSEKSEKIFTPAWEPFPDLFDLSSLARKPNPDLFSEIWTFLDLISDVLSDRFSALEPNPDLFNFWQSLMEPNPDLFAWPNSKMEPNPEVFVHGQITLEPNPDLFGGWKIFGNSVWSRLYQPVDSEKATKR